MLRHYINHPRNYEQLSLVGVKVGTGAINNSASKSSIRRRPLLSQREIV